MVWYTIFTKLVYILYIWQRSMDVQYFLPIWTTPHSIGLLVSLLLFFLFLLSNPLDLHIASPILVPSPYPTHSDSSALPSSSDDTASNDVSRQLNPHTLFQNSYLIISSTHPLFPSVFDSQISQRCKQMLLEQIK